MQKVSLVDCEEAHIHLCNSYIFNVQGKTKLAFQVHKSTNSIAEVKYTEVHTVTSTSPTLAALLTAATTWGQLRHPPARERMLDCGAAVPRDPPRLAVRANKQLAQTTTWVNLTDLTLSRRGQTQEEYVPHIYDSIYVKFKTN